MANWNMYSEEVSKARTFVRKMGNRYGRYAGASLRDDSYKAQALCELARRLEAEVILEEQNRRINKMIDALEAADMEVPA